MFTPIVDEMKILLQSLMLNLDDIIEEQNEAGNNTCSFIKYEGMLSQLQQDIERVSATSMNIRNHIENVIKTAMDGNYSAKMKVINDENALLRKRINILEDEIETTKRNLNNGNKIRAGKIKKVKENIEVEENLEL